MCHLMEHLGLCGFSLNIMAKMNVTYESFDAVNTILSFEEIKHALEDRVIPILPPGNEDKVRRVFDIRGEYKTYVCPNPDAYQECCEQALKDAVADVFENLHDPSKTVLI